MRTATVHARRQLPRASNNIIELGPARKQGRLSARIVLAVLAVLLVVGGLFVWNRWFRFDDAADLQGVWVDEAGAQLALDGTRMLVGDSVAYDYTVDAATKTISYEFNGAVGYSAYRFSGDRSTLALRDVQQGGGTDWLMILHIREDPLLTALDPQAATPEGCSRLERKPGSAADALAAFDTKPSNLKEYETVGADLFAEEHSKETQGLDDAASGDADGADSAAGVQEGQYDQYDQYGQEGQDVQYGQEAQYGQDEQYDQTGQYDQNSQYG